MLISNEKVLPQPRNSYFQYHNYFAGFYLVLLAPMTPP